ncbi:ribose-phosphate pyrophosphokinase 4 [Desulfonema ishimotonii]|uniref:Ribose-phosphate pyrophosphokinase 4 n=1 Tax=Desulfonema ishimotonii TaxID=45657 RepID=A0A401FZE1_9BACT|nr:ribose-phosphate diphosphokinase [Desulfonema ishimotonii]GBC62362.1 ribose-phosphate pyrophosphokinase 4 [Desulfonema ishimotonii]
MIFLYHCPQMKELAERIARIRPDVLPGRIDWSSFRDGYPNLKILDAGAARNRDIVFLASFDRPSEIFKQISVIYEIPRLVVRSFKILLPYYPTGTMERVEQEGEIATAFTLARMLSIIPHSASGPSQIVIYDIHALQERFYFSDAVIPRLESAIPLIRARLRHLENIAIAFPDEGALKRFSRMFPEYPLVICHKIREGNQRIVSIREGNPSGRHVVIIDDLVMTGGTLLETRKVLEENGAAKVSAYVTHGVFPDESWKKFSDAGFFRFWITDSCPRTAEAVRGKSPFEVLSLDQAIADILV